MICQTNLMKKWTFYVLWCTVEDDSSEFLCFSVINWHKKTCVYQEYTDKIYRLISFVAVILQRKITSFTLK